MHHVYSAKERMNLRQQLFLNCEALAPFREDIATWLSVLNGNKEYTLNINNIIYMRPGSPMDPDLYYVISQYKRVIWEERCKIRCEKTNLNLERMSKKFQRELQFYVDHIADSVE